MLSKDYINALQKLQFECEKGHIFYLTLNHMLVRDSWCIYCKNKTQTKLYYIIKELFPGYKVVQNFKGFKWLGRQEIDIWVPGLKLAVEYDGKQHFMPINWGKMTDKEAYDKFIELKRLDEQKNNLIKENKKDIDFFVRFNYKEKITKETVKIKLENI